MLGIVPMLQAERIASILVKQLTKQQESPIQITKFVVP